MDFWQMGHQKYTIKIFSRKIKFFLFFLQSFLLFDGFRRITKYVKILQRTTLKILFKKRK